MVEVRVARGDELTAIVAAFGQEWFFVDRLERQGRDEGELFVAWVDGAPVGDVYLWRDRPYEGLVREHLEWTPTITHLEVAPAWQGRGIGTALMRAAEQHATTLGYVTVGLGVGVDNPRARRLYERLGYAEWEHGPVEVTWDEPGPDGAPVTESLTCHWLVRPLVGEAPPVDDWEAWTPAQAAHVLRDSTVDWYVAGGWAIDLYLGRPTRPHEDIEVAITRGEFGAWRELLSGYDLYDVGYGRVRRLHPGVEPDPANHQVWAADRDRPVWRMDTFLEDRTTGEWACHWFPDIRVPRDEAVARTPDGIAYLRPEYTLLAKAKRARPKDEADLAQVLPTLDGRARDRLRDGVRAARPDHPWLARLEG